MSFGTCATVMYRAITRLAASSLRFRFSALCYDLTPTRSSNITRVSADAGEPNLDTDRSATRRSDAMPKPKPMAAYARRNLLPSLALTREKRSVFLSGVSSG
jgi:hypothetical protein